MATLHRRSDGWGRTRRRVSLLVENNGFPSPATLGRGGRRSSVAITIGWSSRSTPVTPAARSLIRCAPRSFACPAIAGCSVGTDILGTAAASPRLRTAMFWGVGASVLLATLFGLSYSAPHSTARESSRGDVRIHHGRQLVTAPARRAGARRIRCARNRRESHARNHRATDRNPSHDFR